MTRSNRIHITQRPDGSWAETREGAQRASALHDKQAGAERSAKDRLRNGSGGEVIIHRPNGQIRDSDTIGKADPFPPRDRKH